MQSQASPKLPEEAPQEKQPKAQPQKRGGTAAAPAELAKEEDQLPMPEVLRRLRALEQPITLFGEVKTSR